MTRAWTGRRTAMKSLSKPIASTIKVPVRLEPRAPSQVGVRAIEDEPALPFGPELKTGEFSIPRHSTRSTSPDGLREVGHAWKRSEGWIASLRRGSAGSTGLVARPSLRVGTPPSPLRRGDGPSRDSERPRGGMGRQRRSRVACRPPPSCFHPGVPEFRWSRPGPSTKPFS